MNTQSSSQSIRPSVRLASLDILRGFDLFMLVWLQPVVLAVGAVWCPDWMSSLLYQLDHETWEGFRCWDLVMPLFLFMTGVAMPFSLSRYQQCGDKRGFYLKIFRRFAVLFLLGMVVQGNLLGFDFNHIYFYTNTLQAIATGYLISAIIMVNLSLRWQIVATVVLLTVYSVPMYLWGDFTPEGNFANMVDEVVMGRFRGDPSYTWLWSGLTFAVTVMTGTFAGRLMRNGTRRDVTPDATGAGGPKSDIALQLLFIGLAMIAVGWLWGLSMPIIKRLWTSSMTLLSSGYCFVLMALFYYVIDVKGHSRGLRWLKVYGMNSIAAYILGETINFRSIVQSLSYGLEPLMGEWYGVWLTAANFSIVFLILLWMYRDRLFLKI